MHPAIALLLLLFAIGGCEAVGVTAPSFTTRSQDLERHRMVESQLVAGGIQDPAVLRAMRRVPRHRFVPADHASLAYDDRPLPIGYGQTISQPYVVALMTEALALKPEDKVLEIGTGSGYQSAILAEITSQVFTIEIVQPLAERAAGVLADLGYLNVRVRLGDGSQGWPEEAPFNAIIVTAAAAAEAPRGLLDQLAVGGRLVLPVGEGTQRLILYRRTVDGYIRTDLGAVRFVPLVEGSIEHGDRSQLYSTSNSVAMPLS